jgi:hypothetical protein
MIERGEITKEEFQGYQTQKSPRIILALEQKLKEVEKTEEVQSVQEEKEIALPKEIDQYQTIKEERIETRVEENIPEKRKNSIKSKPNEFYINRALDEVGDKEIRSGNFNMSTLNVLAKRFGGDRKRVYDIITKARDVRNSKTSTNEQTEKNLNAEDFEAIEKYERAERIEQIETNQEAITILETNKNYSEKQFPWLNLPESYTDRHSGRLLYAMIKEHGEKFTPLLNGENNEENLPTITIYHKGKELATYSINKEGKGIFIGENTVIMKRENIDSIDELLENEGKSEKGKLHKSGKEEKIIKYLKQSVKQLGDKEEVFTKTIGNNNYANLKRLTGQTWEEIKEKIIAYRDEQLTNTT